MKIFAGRFLSLPRRVRFLWIVAAVVAANLALRTLG
jgi:hypothetical protein